jgi:hypothetical protein
MPCIHTISSLVQVIVVYRGTKGSHYVPPLAVEVAGIDAVLDREVAGELLNG